MQFDVDSTKLSEFTRMLHENTSEGTPKPGAHDERKGASLVLSNYVHDLWFFTYVRAPDLVVECQDALAFVSRFYNHL